MPRPLLVGIAGGSGSGKTTLCQALLQALGTHRATVIRHDAYYRDRSHLPPAQRATLNYDHPDALETDLLIQHLHQLLSGQPVQCPIYDFVSHIRTHETELVYPQEVIILEGNLLLALPELQEMLHLKVFLDVPADIRFIRRLRRDVVERGRTVESVIAQYLETVRPMHQHFIQPSKRYADLVFTQEDPLETITRVIISHLQTLQ